MHGHLLRGVLYALGAFIPCLVTCMLEQCLQEKKTQILKYCLQATVCSSMHAWRSEGPMFNPRYLLLKVVKGKVLERPSRENLKSCCRFELIMLI